MLIRNLCSWAGHNFSHVYGAIVEVSEEIGLARIDAGVADRAPKGAKVDSVHPPSEAEQAAIDDAARKAAAEKAVADVAAAQTTPPPVDPLS